MNKSDLKLKLRILELFNCYWEKGDNPTAEISYSNGLSLSINKTVLNSLGDRLLQLQKSSPACRQAGSRGRKEPSH